MNESRCFYTLCTIGGFLAVALGAFGAHFLKTRVDEYYLGVFKTGVEYQMYHSLALGFVALWMSRMPSPLLKFAGIAFVIGMVIFSGSLYLLVLTKTKAWGAVTPIGGLSFLVGWFLLILNSLKN